MSTTLIKQIPDDYAESTGLNKYNRSRMPGCRDRFVASLNNDGRYLTGIDEDALNISSEERIKIEEFRKSLEKRTGKDLSATSPFWETYEVVIYADKPKIFNSENPMDVVALKVLFANCYVAPSEKDANTPQYRDAQYYAYTEEGEVNEEITKRKKRDKALVELFGISESKDKLLMYGQYLEGLKYHSKLTEDNLYKMLRAYIEDKNIENTENFIVALKKSPEELQQKVIVDKALKQRLISRVSLGAKKFVYQYGQVTIGNTLEEVYRNLTLPDFAPELRAIIQELEKR